jgi:hypothetical protein
MTTFVRVLYISLAAVVKDLNAALALDFARYRLARPFSSSKDRGIGSGLNFTKHGGI